MNTQELLEYFERVELDAENDDYMHVFKFDNFEIEYNAYDDTFDLLFGGYLLVADLDFKVTTSMVLAYSE